MRTLRPLPHIYHICQEITEQNNNQLYTSTSRRCDCFMFFFGTCGPSPSRLPLSFVSRCRLFALISRPAAVYVFPCPGLVPAILSVPCPSPHPQPSETKSPLSLRIVFSLAYYRHLAAFAVQSQPKVTFIPPLPRLSPGRLEDNFLHFKPHEVNNNHSQGYVWLWFWC